MKALISKLLTLLGYIFMGLALLGGLKFIVSTVIFSYKMHGIIAAIMSVLFIYVSPFVYLFFAWNKYESMVNPYSTGLFLSVVWTAVMWGLVFLVQSFNEKLKG